VEGMERMKKFVYDVTIHDLPLEELNMLLEWTKKQNLKSFEVITIVTRGGLEV
jgi:hypothetical protein